METVAGRQSTGPVQLEEPTVMEEGTGNGTGLDSPGGNNQGHRPPENKHDGEPDQVIVDSPVVEEATEVVTTSSIVEVQALSEQIPESNNSQHHNNHRRKQQNPRASKYQPQHPAGTENIQQGLHWAAVETQVLSPASMMHQLYIAVPQSSGPMDEEDEDDVVLVKPAGSLTKRERDKLKKRELRSNPIYREKEKERARERMRLKRADPNFRAVEREKDRKRRRLARQRNELLRRFEHNKIRTLNGIDPTDLPVTTCQDNSPGLYIP
ncbi:Hypp8123 [Branchiostoma lanceolatum]|uniref:Hypp8123 protein n=1 Tax=Branchiostoma lanceolatum TaxID=7740 RepID=A0A8J9Z617_BRALA|nr:Hypp8123 [Branchiostoma lanceolatum]